MGILDGLFSNSQLESQRDGNEPGPGWLGSLFRAPASPDHTPATDAAASSDQPNPLTALLGGNAISGGIAGLLGHGGQGGASQAPTLLDRLTAGATNLTTGGNPLAGILNAVNGVATGQRTDRAGIELAKQHATMSALINAGLDFKTARAAAMNPEYLKALVVARYGVRPKHGQATAASRPAGNETDRSEPIATNDVDANSGRTGVPSADTARPQS
jgi:hypothetical protein